MSLSIYASKLTDSAYPPPLTRKIPLKYIPFRFNHSGVVFAMADVPRWGDYLLRRQEEMGHGAVFCAEPHPKVSGASEKPSCGLLPADLQ